MNLLYPLQPVLFCPSDEEIKVNKPLERCGTIILAGGQGSRLGISGPKGVFEINGKSLFASLFEKAPKKNWPIAVMTSPLNHQATIDFFEKHDYFGCEIYFFQQTMRPFLDENKQAMKVEGPDGNGSLFKAFKSSGLLNVFVSQNIEAVTILPVDNPLAHPKDEKLLVHHLNSCSDFTLKCVKRSHPLEQMGALVQREGRVEITEYLHLDPTLSYQYSYIGIMAMSLSFLGEMGEIELPLHFVKKTFQGRPVFKGEHFLFDVLPYAQKTEALCCEREKWYTPVKSPVSIYPTAQL
jgi:UDP-N-acetylglucosamine pyrophosphorylase